MRTNLLFLYFLFIFSSLGAITILEDTVVYKIIGDNKMRLFITYDQDKSRLKPCIVFFYGGGWVKRNNNQFKDYCDYFAKKGYVCIRAEYRVTEMEKSTPFESLSDARSAIRYVRMNSYKFNIIPENIIAVGGSAGGHLAAACASTKKFDDIKDNVSISCVPNALVLFNPVIDNGPAGYGYERIGKMYKEFSPLHNLHSGMPPTTIFIGDKDKLIPVETIEYYVKAMNILGVRCDLHLYKNEGHGFFNSKKYKTVMINEMERFLLSLDL